ncbi:MAG: hypothetical protein WCS03_06555 [Bacteroidota bacterium]
MKKKLNTGITGLLISLLIFVPSVSNGQSEKAVVKKYLTELPRVQVSNKLQKYRMTAVYTNRDLYGNFTGKQKVTGEYTRGLENGFATWNNIFIAGSNSFSEPFPAGKRQDYMENIKYIPSSDMLNAKAFNDFPATTESVYAKNLIWDMMMIEDFAWEYSDSLKLNKNYIIPDINGEFEMADIGTYSHNSIQICWTGISLVNDKLCAVIEYRALDNKIELKMDQIKTKGTEQYWGTTWIALDNKQIEHAEIYGGTIQEIEVAGLKDKFLIKTIRDLIVERIQ